MYFKQFYLGCLAHASYLIGSEGEAVVVDPQRDVDQYFAEAAAQNLTIKYVIETHLHADFVSGHLELKQRTANPFWPLFDSEAEETDGAEIVFSGKAEAYIPHRSVKDGEVLTVGSLELRILETPGHTPESICILVTDTKDAEAPAKLLTGDTLFVGDVGRPDLAGGKGYTPSVMAAMMYDTLHEKLLKLPDETEVYPAHGAGSMCGKNMSKETSSTIGAQKKFNYALQPMSRDEFVRMMTSDLSEAPSYFQVDAAINRRGAKGLCRLGEPLALSAAEIHGLKSMTSVHYVVLDVRSAEEFGKLHIAGSLNVGLRGQFAIWAGCLIPPNARILLVAETKQDVYEAKMRLARVGLDDAYGYLKGNIFEPWSGCETGGVPQISVTKLNSLLSGQEVPNVLDVRTLSEYNAGHVPGALHAPLLTLKKSISDLLSQERKAFLSRLRGSEAQNASRDEAEVAAPEALIPLRKVLDRKKPLAVICAGGYRSSAATSVLQQQGFSNLLNVTGGTSAWIAAGYEVE